MKFYFVVYIFLGILRNNLISQEKFDVFSIIPKPFHVLTLRLNNPKKRKLLRQTFVISDILIKFLIIFTILFQAADIHPNPGPNCLTYSEFIDMHRGNSDKTKYIHVNFQNMKSKPEAFTDVMENLSDNQTVFGFSETWLGDEDSTDQWNFDKNNLCAFRKDRTALSKHRWDEFHARLRSYDGETLGWREIS